MCNCYENKNNNYYPTLDENFNEAVDMFERETSQDELIDLLNTGNIVQRQIAALKIKELRSKEDAISLVQNLIGCDGKIREAVSLKINEFKSSDFLHQEVVYDTFLQAIIDVNSNISNFCRL